MYGLRRHSARFLLTLTLVGGLVAPVVHRAHDAVAFRAHHEAVARQTNHVHFDYAAFSYALADTGVHDLVCVVCKTLSVWRTLAPLRDVAHLSDQDLAGVPAPLALPAFSDPTRPIRGPPTRS